MAEFTSKLIQGVGLQISPSKQLFVIQGVSNTNNDVFTISGISTVLGCFLVATDGTVGTITMATNVVTVTNAGAKTWNGLAWGTP